MQVRSLTLAHSAADPTHSVPTYSGHGLRSFFYPVAQTLRHLFICQASDMFYVSVFVAWKLL